MSRRRRRLYRDLRLDGQFRIDLTVYCAGTSPLSSPPILDYHTAEPNEQFRIDLIAPTAPIDSVADQDVLTTIFATSPTDPVEHQSTEVSTDLSAWQGQTVRLRLAQTDNRGPLRAAVDNIRLQPLGSHSDGRVEFLATEKPSSAVDLVLHRMSEADAVAALAEHAEQRARADQFAGAVLVARHDTVLLEHAWGRADRESGTANTRRPPDSGSAR